jgi:hypothetical protein
MMISNPWMRLACLIAAAGLIACGDDATPEQTPDDSGTDTTDVSDGSSLPEDTDVPEDVPTDVEEPDTDTSIDPDTDGSVDPPDTDAEIDLGPLPECEENERLVGRNCWTAFDRICATDADCRDSESCEPVEGNEFGICIYQFAPPLVCPGSEGCEQPTDAPVLRAGFAARVVTPQGWELAREGFASDPDEYGSLRSWNGDVTLPRHFCDCGRDLICPPDLVESGCYSIGTWTAPDADGTEGDRYMSGAWLAGFGNNRNAALCPEELLGDDCVHGNDCCDNQFAHDDLWARGFVVDYGFTRIGVVVLDNVGYFYSEVERIEDTLDPSLGIDQIIVSSTHDHEAPDTMGRWGPGVGGSGLPGNTGIIPPWMAEMRAAVQEVLAEAVAELEPVDIYVGQVNSGAPGFATRDSRDPFIFNDVLGVMQFVPAGTDPAEPGNTIGTVLNYHTHVEALGGGNAYITSDFVHYSRQAMEEGLPAARDEELDIDYPARPALGGVSVFVVGSVGGLLTQLSATMRSRDGVDYREDSYDKAWAQGTQLAELAHGVLENRCEDGIGARGCSVKLEDTAVSFASRELMLDIENLQFEIAAISLALFDREVYNWRSDLQTPTGPWAQVLTRVSQLRIGPVTFQTMPGEAFSETVVGYYHADAQDETVIWGNPNDLNCDVTGETRLDAGVEPRFGCLVRENHENPPDLDARPDGQDDYLRGFIPGEFFFMVGMGNDELGYLVPSYDFKWSSRGLGSVDGDHYEETVSAGDELPDILNAVREINTLLSEANAD